MRAGMPVVFLRDLFVYRLRFVGTAGTKIRQRRLHLFVGIDAAGGFAVKRWSGCGRHSVARPWLIP